MDFERSWSFLLGVVTIVSRLKRDACGPDLKAADPTQQMRSITTQVLRVSEKNGSLSLRS